MQTAFDVISDPALVTGIVGGLTVLSLGILFWSIRGHRVQTFGGLAVAGVTLLLLFLDHSDMVGPSQIVGVALLAVAGWLHRSVAIGALLAVPGAFLIIRPVGFGAPAWLPWVAFVAVVIAAPLVASFDLRYWMTGLGLPLFGLATLGVFLTVPDTEGALVLLGVAGVTGFLGWPKPFASLGGAGAYAVVGVYALVAMEGARGRPASMIASVAVLGLLLLVPIAMRMRQAGWAHDLDRFDPLGSLLAQLGLVVVIARTAGRIESVVWATALTAALLAGAAVLLLALPSRRPSHLSD